VRGSPGQSFNGCPAMGEARWRAGWAQPLEGALDVWWALTA
jgi:hypothetical protein